MNAPHQNALAIVEPSFAPMAIESASTFAAAAAKASVEARYLIALRKPRDWDQVRAAMLKECSRPSFANNKSALYRKPIGAGVEGLGIRFAEMAVRCMTNLLIESALVFEDDGKEIHRITITDLESNVTYPLDVAVGKTVERSKPEDDGTYLRVRTNSYGKPVYTVRGTDDDLLNKRGALISKAIRTIALRIIPGDILDECEDRIRSIRKSRAAVDPDAERKALVDEFAEQRITPAMLAEYLGHSLAECSTQELVDLRGLLGAIADGEASWAQAMEAKAEGKPAPRKETSPAWPADSFKARMPKWQAAIDAGKGTEEILAFARSKGALTPEQESAIRNLKPSKPVPPSSQREPGSDDEPDFGDDTRGK